MNCLSHNEIQSFITDELNPIERMRYRDHLVVCQRCRDLVTQYKSMESALLEPVWLEQPNDLEKRVIKNLFPQRPSRVSLFFLLLTSFALFVALLYVSFDMSNNGVIQTLQASTADTTSLVGLLIRMVTGSFKIIYAMYKAMDTLIHALSFGFLSIELVLLLTFTMALFFAKRLLRLKRVKETGK